MIIIARSVMTKRIDTKTSRTAELTCLSRAASFLENEETYRSGDSIAPLLLPETFKLLFKVGFFRNVFTGLLAPKGLYEYVIARTKYIDAAFEKAIEEQVDQVLIFGAGFDTRALRFQEKLHRTRVFELDVAITQQAKINQFGNRGLRSPPQLTYIAIDFEKEKLAEKLDAAGFQKNRADLFILEGLLMYLQPDAVRSTLQIISAYAGRESRMVFDYVRASILKGQDHLYGASSAVKTVENAGEQWQFGSDREGIERLLSECNFRIIDHLDAAAIGKIYFEGGKTRVNETHCLVTAEKE
jgi:methyltransferase (TIGR00027 family)